MTVLLVDDQISILSGLISGIDWDALGVDAIRTAGNVAQAKKILAQEKVDAMLCDIEMPGENGLSLLRWARSKGMDLVCEFLTSHADFLYAKEAIQLGCFDYILQPARYEDIQAAVTRALNRVQADRKDKELEYYGIYAKNHPGGVFQNLFGGWLAGGGLSLSKLRTMLGHFHKELPAQCSCALVIGQLLRWRANPWPMEEWSYGLNNIFVELFGNAGIEAIPFSIDQSSLGWFLYAREQFFPQRSQPLQVLEGVYLYLAQYFPCDFAFYLGNSLPVEEMGPQAEKLLRAKRDNVLQKSGVFSLDRATCAGDSLSGVDTVQMRRWENLLAAGEGRILQEEVFRYLNELSAEETFDYQHLHNLWLQFQQAVLNVMWGKQLGEKEILTALRSGETAQSLQAVKAAIEKTAACFVREDQEQDSQTVAQTIEQYVENHLDSPLTVGDIANAMFLNPDYLSRLFKNEYGVPLKEHIVTRKMRAAQVLLKTTALPVGVIASKVGYDNYSYFSQAYKKAIGHSPSEERKK